jgi:hypothetical protein
MNRRFFFLKPLFSLSLLLFSSFPLFLSSLLILYAPNTPVPGKKSAQEYLFNSQFIGKAYMHWGPGKALKNVDGRNLAS